MTTYRQAYKLAKLIETVNGVYDSGAYDRVVVQLWEGDELDAVYEKPYTGNGPGPAAMPPLTAKENRNCEAGFDLQYAALDFYHENGKYMRAMSESCEAAKIFVDALNLFESTLDDLEEAS